MSDAPTTRVVVTGHDEEGSSVVLYDGPAVEVPGRRGIGITGLWVHDPARGLDHVCGPDTDYATLQPPPAAASWRVYVVPPDEVRDAHLRAAGVDDVEQAAFHTTGTVDFQLVLDGEVVLALDHGEVVLGPGDCVVQRFTRHAWHNRSGRPARIMAVMISTA